jgi:hypothetical protein
VSTAQLLSDLSRRGIRLALVADGLHYEDPQGALTANDRAAIAAHRSELLELLRTKDEGPVPSNPCGLCGSLAVTEVHAGLSDAERERLNTEAATGDSLARLVLDAVHCTPEPAAWRLDSRRLGTELWVVRDSAALAELEKNGAGLPVVHAADLPQLHAFEDQRLNDLLDVLAIFPGARLAQLPKGELADV